MKRSQGLDGTEGLLMWEYMHSFSHSVSPDKLQVKTREEKKRRTRTSHPNWQQQGSPSLSIKSCQVAVQQHVWLLDMNKEMFQVIMMIMWVSFTWHDMVTTWTWTSKGQVLAYLSGHWHPYVHVASGVEYTDGRHKKYSKEYGHSMVKVFPFILSLVSFL